MEPEEKPKYGNYWQTKLRWHVSPRLLGVTSKLFSVTLPFYSSNMVIVVIMLTLWCLFRYLCESVCERGANFSSPISTVPVWMSWMPWMPELWFWIVSRAVLAPEKSWRHSRDFFSSSLFVIEALLRYPVLRLVQLLLHSSGAYGSRQLVPMQPRAHSGNKNCREMRRSGLDSCLMPNSVRFALDLGVFHYDI